MGNVTEAQGRGLGGAAGRDHGRQAASDSGTLTFFIFWLEMTFLRYRSNSACGGQFINCFERPHSRSVFVVYLCFRLDGYFCFLADKNMLLLPLSTEVTKS